MSGGIDMMRSTPINALRRDEVQDPQTRDMVDGIVHELEYSGGLPGGNGGGGYPGDNYEGMHGNPQMMDYGVPEGGYYPPEYSGASGLPPGDPRGGQQFPGDGQYQQGPPPEYYPPRMEMGAQPPQHPQHPQMKSNGGMFSNLTDLFYANSREPMLAAVLYLIMSNDTVSALLSRYIPYASSPVLGLFIRAALVAILFFIAKLFVLRH